MNEQSKKACDAEDDEVLIRRFLDNDNASFERLVAKYQDMIFGLCFRFSGDYDEASDSAQETFIKVYRHLKNFRFKSNFTTWLYRIAVNTCRNRMTSASSRIRKNSMRLSAGDSGQDHVEIEDETQDPTAIFERNEEARIIHEAINALPPSLKVLVVLRDLEGKSYEEIAAITGSAIGTVKSRLARARHLLRVMLKDVF